MTKFTQEQGGVLQSTQELRRRWWIGGREDTMQAH